MIQQILADRKIPTLPCDLQYLDAATISILLHNPSDSLDAWAVRLRSGEVVLLIPDTEDKAWLFVEEEGQIWILGDDGIRVRMTRAQIESRIDEPLRRCRHRLR